MNTKRQPKGIPVGGQFAANDHDEAASALEQYIVENDILAIDERHMDAVEKVVGEKDSLVTTSQAEELLSAPSGSRPRMYGLMVKDDDQYEIVKIGSVETLHKHDLAAQWLSGTTVEDLVSPARSVSQSREDDREAFEALRDTPTDADYEDTFDTIEADISNASFPRGENSWESVIGARSPRTAANLARYREHIARVAQNDPEWRAKHTRYAKINAELRSYSRAYHQGISIDPKAEAYFEENWNDPNSNFGEEATRRELAQNAFDKDALMIGTLKPSRVVGTGYRNPKKAAKEYLDRREAELKEALASRGRSYSTVASNALSRAKRGWE